MCNIGCREEYNITQTNSHTHHTFFAHLAQSVERKTFNLVAVGSTPTVGTSSLV